jgi:hypothetical protein
LTGLKGGFNEWEANVWGSLIWERELVSMVTTRDSVVEVLRNLGEHDRATVAACCLPKYVDTDRDAMRLHEFGLSERVLQAEIR